MASQAFRIYDVPQEVRDQIYNLYLADLFETMVQFRYHHARSIVLESRRYSVPLLTVCRQIYGEIKQYMQKPRSLHYDIGPQTSSFDGYAAFGFRMRGHNPDLNSTPDLVLCIHPPQREQTWSLVRLWYQTLSTVKLLSNKRINSLTIQFMENEVGAWSYENKPASSFRPFLGGETRTDIEMISDLLSTYVKGVNKIKVWLPLDLRKNEHVQRHLCHMKQSMTEGSSVDEARARGHVTSTEKTFSNIEHQLSTANLAEPDPFLDSGVLCNCLRQSARALFPDTKRFASDLWLWYVQPAPCCHEGMTQNRRGEHYKFLTGVDLAKPKTFCEVQKVEMDRWIDEEDDLGIASLSIE